MMTHLFKFHKGERGAVQIVEMTVIFPLVLFVMGALIYMSSYILQSVTIYNDAQRIAIAASREAAFPGYEYLYDGTGVTTKADFNWGKGHVPGVEVINYIMKQHEPYRYWGTGFLSNSEKTSLENNLKRLVKNSSFLADSNVDCEITASNNILNQQVQVHVIKYVSAPGILRFFGITDHMNIDVTAVAVVGDPAEFIRNTDMVFDLTEFMFDHLKIKGKTVNERIAEYKEKFANVKEKLGI